VQPGAPRVIVDSFGLVGETLMRVQSAVIGGSFGSDDHIGGHNLWEPLLAGCRLAIGPHYHNQRALAERLQARGLLHIIVDTSNTTFDVEQNRSGDLTEPDFAMRHALIHEEHKRLNEAAARVIAVLNERDAAQDAHFS
jgi:3-deoxy-D-manno-octulosonic-acid transferase